MTAALVHVDKADLLAEPWRWTPFVTAACAWRGSQVDAVTVWGRITTDPSYACFAACEGGAVRAFVAVQRHDEPTLEIVLLAGRGIGLVRRLWPTFRDLARFNGCDRIIAGGRKGWARLTGMTITGRGERGAYRMEERL